jgi:hypothetical protein
VFIFCALALQVYARAVFKDITLASYAADLAFASERTWFESWTELRDLFRLSVQQPTCCRTVVQWRFPRWRRVPCLLLSSGSLRCPEGPATGLPPNHSGPEQTLFKIDFKITFPTESRSPKFSVRFSFLELGMCVGAY